MQGVVHHIGITVSNLEKSLSFYEAVLHSAPIYQMERVGESIEKITGVPGAKLRVAMFAAENTEVELIEYVVPKGRAYDRTNNDAGSMHLCFQVDDVRAAYAALCEKGVRFLNPPVEVTEGPTAGWVAAYCLDPDGVSVEVAQLPVRPGAATPQDV